MLSSLHRLLQLSLATLFVVWCSAVHGLALPSTIPQALISSPQASALQQCIERVASGAQAQADAECQLDAAPPTQQRFHAPDLLGLDDAPEDEDLGAASGELTIYGPSQGELCHLDDRLAPKLAPHSTLERPPRV